MWGAHRNADGIVGALKLSFNVTKMPLHAYMQVQVSRERLLTVSGKRESTSATQLPTGFQRSERDVGSFQRQFQLPETADISNITAKAEDGVLSIEVAKLDAAGSGVSEVAIA